MSDSTILLTSPPVLSRGDDSAAARLSAAQPRSECGSAEILCAALAGQRRQYIMVNAATLGHCYRYLSRNLSLPCEAWYPEPTDENGGHPCTLTELIDPATGLGDKFAGIFCKIRKGEQDRSIPLVKLQLSADDPNRPLAERYGDCFWHWR